MNLPKSTARVMHDLANVIEEALIPSGYDDLVIDEVDAKKALRKFEQWRKAAMKLKPKPMRATAREDVHSAPPRTELVAPRQVPK